MGRTVGGHPCSSSLALARMPVGTKVGHKGRRGIPNFPCLGIGVVAWVVGSRLHLKAVEPFRKVKNPFFDPRQREVGLGHRVIKVQLGQFIALGNVG